MILGFISLWLLVGLLGSLLGRRALNYRFPRTAEKYLTSLDFVMSIYGPVNVFAVLVVFGKDCFKRF